MSMIPAEDGNKNPADVERLLALAGPRDAVPAERLQRMRAAVHGAWAAETNQAIDAKPRAIGAFLWPLLMAAAAGAVAITAVRMWTDAGIRERAKAPARAAAISIKTGPAERKTLSLAAGGELRVDASSLITIDENSEIHITRGAIYLDSKTARLPAVITPAGRITDTGTRFEVRMIGGNTRVRVRSGEVRLTQAKSVTDVSAAEELLARSQLDASIESIARRHVDPFGAEWAWVTRAAPRFELEGRSLGNFIDWIENEGAWTVVFASPALERRARSTELHGSIERMSTTEALDTILPACGLGYHADLKTGRVIVMASAK